MANKRKNAPAESVKYKKVGHSGRSRSSDRPRPVDFEAAKHALRDVLRAEVESETVPSDVLSFRMKCSR
jgi:hypothetical protein